jgi:hypothetical protein
MPSGMDRDDPVVDNSYLESRGAVELFVNRRGWQPHPRHVTHIFWAGMRSVHGPQLFLRETLADEDFDSQ